jgi:hypothetical protein
MDCLSGIPAQNLVPKKCSRCSATKETAEFCRSRGDNPPSEHATCNQCYESRKNKRQETDLISRKRAKLASNQNKQPSTSNSLSRENSSNSFSHLDGIFEDLELVAESSFLEEQLPDAPSANTQGMQNPDDNDMGELLYNLDEVQELVARKFQVAENFGEPATFVFEIELDSKLLESVLLSQEKIQQNMSELTTIKDNFHQLTNVLLVPFELGSGYYWEVRQLYLNTRKKEFTCCATAYLGCTQREDREWQRPEDLPKKRRSEVRPQIKRHACMGKIKLIMDPQKQRVLVDGTHLHAHEHPQYRRAEFPAAARQWIKDNVQYHLHNSEMYRRLQQLDLIDANVHTKEQVYYWASTFSKQTYMSNSKNQLLSAKEFLEQPDLRSEGFKVLSYLENDFVRALGFATPFINRIGISQIKEIVVDSTFKTNQERFELFVVNANCGGYGMPVAYLYLLTSTGTEAASHNPENQIKTRVQALCQFFTSLRHEGLLPVFVLVDKDAGEIAAVDEAWSRTANIQLCYWHLEHAINRRLKDKRSKVAGYSKDKAMEAHQQFDFIDALWTPNGGAGNLCSDEEAKEVVNMVKQHANMHPLIPVDKNTFWSYAQIYRHCAHEMYQFCHNNGLSKLWGYLWSNWYNRKDWKLFARSAYPSAMPLARTTMITESHWRVLKYNYKYKYNRPRLDCLTQVLAKQLIPDLDFKLTQYNTNRSFPAWWQAFKKSWDKVAAMEIAPGMDDRYHIDVSDWICSCPAYLHSPYLLCKHLVTKKSGKVFLPTFMETARRHDYPLVIFGSARLPAISHANDPWERHGTVRIDEPTEETTSHAVNLRDKTLTRTNAPDEIEEKLDHYKKIFDTALALYSREKDNAHFVKSFDGLMKPIVRAIEECEEDLDARTQQSTWGSKKGKLAFWLR